MKSLFGSKLDLSGFAARSEQRAADLQAKAKAPDQKTAVEQVSPSLAGLLRPQAAYRWLLPSLSAITPQYIEMTLRGALAGNHVQAWELFDLMLDTDPEISSCCTELIEGVLKKKLIIEPYHEEDEEPSPSAIQKQKVVSAALRRMRPDPAADENDLKGTLKDILSAQWFGQVVLETDWSAGYGSEELNIINCGDLGNVIAPRATSWVHPVCYAWSMEGRLGMRKDLNTLRQGANNRQPGNVWNSTSYQPRPAEVDEFPEHKFLIGIRKNKSGSALGGAQLRVLAWWWCASNFCGDWLLNLAQLFGIPFRKAKYQSGIGEGTKEEIRQMLQNCGSAGYILLPDGADVELIEGGGGAQTSPQAFLFEFADRQKRKVILGQTMSGSGQSSAGKGGLAGMSVESDVKQCRIDAAGDAACAVVNQQLIRSILWLNYRNDDEAPACRLLEENEGGVQDAQRDQILINAGLEVGENFMRKKYGVPAPAKGERILKPSSDGPVVAGDKKEEPTLEAKDTSEPAPVPSNIDLAQTLHEMILPILKRLEAIAQINDEAIQKHMLEKLLNDFPQIKEAIRSDNSLAKKLSPHLEAALIEGLKKP